MSSADILCRKSLHRNKLQACFFLNYLILLQFFCWHKSCLLEIIQSLRILMLKIFAAFVISLSAQVTYANVLTIDFTIRPDMQTGEETPVSSKAKLTLSLKDNGMVGAILDVGADQTWSGVGVDTPWYFRGYDNTQGGNVAWGTSYAVGNFQVGLYCYDVCKGPASWTIYSFYGPMTSAWQVVGGTDSKYDAMFRENGIIYTGMAVEAGSSNVPEPDVLSLFGLGFPMIYVLRRRVKRSS